MTQGILYFIFEDMHKDIDITLNPKQAALYDELKHAAALKSNIKENRPVWAGNTVSKGEKI